MWSTDPMTANVATVATTNGPVRGHTGPGCLTFRAIPFAAAPVGDLRWAAPAPPAPWTEPRDALDPGPASWQPVGGPLDGLVPGMGSEIQGDDCLHLEVHTPSVDGARPVLVWIHGGAFSLGANSLGVYDGSRLAAAGDVVVVTINYRLGALGFLMLGDPSCTPNVGLLDQVAALAWVRDNIAAFGGDPSRVTIFGESAGGGSVLSLLSMPVARGLFAGAIVQSGATDLLLEPVRAAEVATTFARCAGVEPGDIDALRALSGPEVIAAQSAAAMELFATVGTMPFHPCVDGTVMPETWLEAARNGSNPVPVIIGTTRDEMDLFRSFDPEAGSLDAPHLRTRLAAVGGDVDALIDAYASTGAVEPPEVWRRANTDISMWLPALRIASARAEHGPTWMYRFDWEARSPDMGAPHGVDIPFAFDTIDRDGWDEFVDRPHEARALAAIIGGAWSSFARQGRPMLDGIDWPRYDAGRRHTALFGPTITIESDPNGAVRRAWS